MRDRRSDTVDHARLNNFQSSHLLAEIFRVIPLLVRPSHAARRVMRSASARLCRRLCSCFKLRHDHVVGEGRNLGRGCHPSREVALE